MPKRHQFIILALVALFVVGICGYIAYRNQVKEATSRQYAEFIPAAPIQPSSTKNQEKLMAAIGQGKALKALPFHGVPYIMFTLQAPAAPTDSEQPVTFCLFPNGRAAAITIRDEHEMAVIRKDLQSMLLYGFSRDEQNAYRQMDRAWYCDRTAWVGQWRMIPGKTGHLQIRERDGSYDMFNGRLFMDDEDIPSLSVTRQNDDEPEQPQTPALYKATDIPAMDRTLCSEMQLCLNAPTCLLLSVDFMEQAISEMASRLRIDPDMLYPCVMNCEYEPFIIIKRRDIPSPLQYEIRAHENGAQIRESFLERPLVTRTFALPDAMSGLEDAGTHLRTELRLMPEDDRNDTAVITVTLTNPDTVVITAKDDPGFLSGSLTTYTFHRQNLRWRLVETSIADC